MALSCQKVNLRLFWHKQTSRSKQVRAIGDFVPPTIFINFNFINFKLGGPTRGAAGVRIAGQQKYVFFKSLRQLVL